MSSPLRARLWSSDELAASRNAWQALLAQADADPLFMSWDWQQRWWTHHAPYLNARLRLLALYTASGELVGIGPFYSHAIRHRGLPIRRMELLGLAWRDSASVFSEYLDIIARRGYETVVLESVAEWLRSEPGWHDLALPYVKMGSLARRLAREYLGRIGTVRELEGVLSYSVTLPATFAQYTRGLKSGVRRKLLHQRSKLPQGSVEAVEPHAVGETLESLWKLERQRWGVKSSLMHRFNMDYAAFQAGAGGLRLTRLTAEGRTLSILYDVRIGGTEYYLQSAFDPEASRGLSLGYQHIGHALERACNEGLARFDFLAGPGRYRDYKQDLAGDRTTLVCYHVIRSGWLRALHWTYELPRRWRQSSRVGVGFFYIRPFTHLRTGSRRFV